MFCHHSLKHSSYSVTKSPLLRIFHKLSQTCKKLLNFVGNCCSLMTHKITLTFHVFVPNLHHLLNYLEAFPKNSVSRSLSRLDRLQLRLRGNSPVHVGSGPKDMQGDLFSSYKYSFIFQIALRLLRQASIPNMVMMATTFFGLFIFRELDLTEDNLSARRQGVW